MSLNRRLAVQFAVLGVWLGLCYALRFYLMEDLKWVDICGPAADNPICAARSGMGLVIHFRVLASAAVLLALPAFWWRGRNGRRLAWLALFVAAPALALYTVTLSVFAALIAGLRLVRDERHSAAASSADAAAQPSA